MDAKKIINDCFTSADNKTFDIGRIGLGYSLLYFSAYGIGQALAGHPWSAMDIATGISTIAVAFAAMLRMKNFTEPGGRDA